MHFSNEQTQLKVEVWRNNNYKCHMHICWCPFHKRTVLGEERDKVSNSVNSSRYIQETKMILFLHCDLGFWPLDFPYCSVENWIEKVMEQKSFNWKLKRDERENAPFPFDSFFSRKKEWILWLNCQIKDLTISSMTPQKMVNNLFRFFPTKNERGNSLKIQLRAF